jgi:RimJ/RimL family protein N-acetyltransferase
MNFQIRQCYKDDVDAFAKHSLFNLTEKGINGIYVHPFPSNHQRSFEEYTANRLIHWTSKPFSPDWEIAWMATVDDKIVGHLNLRCGGIAATAHRMNLGMGIETPYRSMGIGTGLMATCTQWAQRQKEIQWIDLSVFSQNIAARALYKKFGFQETYTIMDAIRIEDQSIDDVQMTLKLSHNL